MKTRPAKGSSKSLIRNSHSTPSQLLGIRQTFGMTRIFTVRPGKAPETDIDLLLQKELDAQKAKP